MINAAQENSSGHVAQALETVLEILKGSELYSPYLGGQQVKQDQMTSELVEGLMVMEITVLFYKLCIICIIFMILREMYPLLLRVLFQQGMKRRQSSIDGSAVHRANICKYQVHQCIYTVTLECNFAAMLIFMYCTCI